MSKVSTARGDPHLIGTAAGEAQQGGVPQVDAVKKAQGDDAVMFHGSFTSKKALDGLEPAALGAAEGGESARRIVDPVFRRLKDRSPAPGRRWKALHLPFPGA